MSRNSIKGKASPKGWREVKLKQNESQRSIRVNPSTKKLKDFLSAPVKNGFSPICVSQPTSKKVLGLGALTGSGLKLDETKWVSESNTEVDKFLIKRGDFLVSRSNTLDKVGRAAFYEGRLKNISYPDLMMKFRVDEKKIDPRFLELILQSYHARKHFMRHASGTSGSMVKITKSVVESLEVPLFSLGMQRSIVNLVFTWKEAIEKTERLIAASEKQFKWLLKRLISDQQNNPEWHKRKLGDVAWVAKGKPQQNLSDRKLLTVKLHCLGIEINKTSFNPRINPKGRPYFERKKGEFLIGRQNFHNGGFGIVPIELDGYIASNAVTSINLNLDRQNSDFLFYSFSRKNYYKKIGHVMDGTGQKELSDRQILDLSFFVPPLSQQKQIAQTLNAAKQEIALLKQLAQKYRTQKLGLMQKVLAQEIAVKT